MLSYETNVPPPPLLLWEWWGSTTWCTTVMLSTVWSSQSIKDNYNDFLWNGLVFSCNLPQWNLSVSCQNECCVNMNSSLCWSSRYVLYKSWLVCLPAATITRSYRCLQVEEKLIWSSICFSCCVTVSCCIMPFATTNKTPSFYLNVYLTTPRELS